MKVTDVLVKDFERKLQMANPRHLNKYFSLKKANKQTSSGGMVTWSNQRIFIIYFYNKLNISYVKQHTFLKVYYKKLAFLLMLFVF